MPEEYYKSKESVEEYINLAKDVNGGKLIESLMQFLPLNAHLLELGSGPGSDWEILSKHFNVVGSDFSREFLQHLATKYPNGTFLELDASSITTSLTFEGIYSNKVLQHLTDDSLKKSIIRQSQILTDNGVICHSFWAGKGSEYFKGMFVNYHSQNDLERFYTPHFEVVEISSYKEFEEKDSLLLIAKKR